MPSRKCHICGRNGWGDPLEIHHVFGGSLRSKSEKYGLVVYLCGNRCHRSGPHAVHRDGDEMRALRKWGQEKAMEAQGWTVDDFIREFGKSYL